eukprot:1157657-Pelagomonas_calceolata.AAC.4
MGLRHHRVLSFKNGMPISMVILWHALSCQWWFCVMPQATNGGSTACLERLQKRWLPCRPRPRQVLHWKADMRCKSHAKLPVGAQLAAKHDLVFTSAAISHCLVQFKGHAQLLAALPPAGCQRQSTKPARAY